MKSEPGARERHPGSRAPPEPEGPPPGRPREDRPEIPRRRDSGGDGHSHKKKKKEKQEEEERRCKAPETLERAERSVSEEPSAAGCCNPCACPILSCGSGEEDLIALLGDTPCCLRTCNGGQRRGRMAHRGRSFGRGWAKGSCGGSSTRIPKARSDAEVQHHRGCFLVTPARPSGVGAGVRRRGFRTGRRWLHSRAGDRLRIHIPRGLAGHESPWLLLTGFCKADCSQVQRKSKEEAPHLLPRSRRTVPDPLRVWRSFEGIRMAPSWRLQGRLVVQKRRQAGGTGFGFIRAGGKRQGQAASWRCAEGCSCALGTTVEPASCQSQSARLLWSGRGRSYIRCSSRAFCGATPGWDLTPAWGRILTAGPTPSWGSSQEGDGSCGSRRQPQQEQGAEDKAQGCGGGAGSCCSRAPIQEPEGGSKETEEVKEPLEREGQEKKEEEGEGIQQSRILGRQFRGGEFECFPSTTAQEEGPQGARLGLPPPYESGGRTAGPGGVGDGRLVVCGDEGAQGEALQLLPAGFEAGAGPSVQGLQGDRPSGSRIGPPSRRGPPAAGRFVGRTAYRRRNSHPSRVADGQIPRDTVVGGRRHCSSPHPVGRPAAFPPGRESRREKLLGPRARVAMGVGGRGKGKGKDPRGKGKKGKQKGKGNKGNWNAWAGGDKEKPSEKGGKGEGS